VRGDVFTEAARVPEDTAGSHLSDLEHHTAQVRHLDGDISGVLFRVRGTAVGPGPTGTALY